MEIMKKLAKLLDVKSLLSLIAAVVFAVLALRGDMEVKDAMVVVILVFQSFFSYQNAKKKEE
jgi:hypothetical protein